MKRIIYIILAVIGYILAAGTVGAADQELIDFTRLVIQSLIAGVFVAVACFGLNLEEKREANKWLKKRPMNKR